MGSSVNARRTSSAVPDHHQRSATCALEVGPIDSFAEEIVNRDRAVRTVTSLPPWQGRGRDIMAYETDQRSAADAPLPPLPPDPSFLRPAPPIHRSAATQIPPDGRAMQVVGFLKSVNWSAISFKGWVVIAIVVMIPIGLVMKAFGYESATGQPPTAARSGSANDGNLPASESPQPNTASPSNTGANPFGGDAPEDSLMPNLICMNLQDAQNEIQDHGVFFSGSVDATGEGRRQTIDSNWVVVGQSPSSRNPHRRRRR